MIVSASYRTDIPAFYGDWFMRRLAAGECLVAIPMAGRHTGFCLIAKRLMALYSGRGIRFPSQEIWKKFTGADTRS